MSPDIVVHSTARPLIKKLCEILNSLQKIKTSEEAKSAFRSFIDVRRQYTPQYQGTVSADSIIEIDSLAQIITAFVAENSEGGKRAQATVSGLMDLFAGPDRVVTSRINDPDRNLPGDVGIRAANDSSSWARIFEVRDKPIANSDIYHFASKLIAAGVEKAAIVAVSNQQGEIDVTEANKWALERGLELSLFVGWDAFVKEVIFWSERPQIEAIRVVVSFIHTRLIEMEVSEEGAELWIAYVKGKIGDDKIR
ncbi:MAG: restriction endonuclease, SacI family, partial [Candidatus Thiodiazotropha sp. (ex Notomyrtea botanica)]|nr:restriction endonuclease, SacI family [Candidatus Thiodiazotropha sp. (ex Notomyrtea botanica)]